MLYERKKDSLKIGSSLFTSDRDRIRTCDRLLRRQMLYPAELRDLAKEDSLSTLRVQI